MQIKMQGNAGLEVPRGLSLRFLCIPCGKDFALPSASINLDQHAGKRRP
jgi:hypothetical protein